MVRLWHYVVLNFLCVGAIQATRTGKYIFLQYFLIYFHCKTYFLFLLIEVYTFEDASHLSAFTAPGTSTLALSTTRYKDANHSMKWNWTSGDSITHSFTSSVSNNIVRYIGNCKYSEVKIT